MNLRHLVSWTGMALLALMMGCATAPVTSFNDPQNTYTPAATYTKYVADFPPLVTVYGALPEGILACQSLTWVKYGRRELQRDFYAPAATVAEQRAAVVLVHGGGWRAGYRENMMPLAY